MLQSETVKKYDTYKDSGIEWIGGIPQGWNMLKLKYISECNKEVLSENTEPNNTIDYIEIGSVTNENGINDYQTLTFENAPSRARRIVKCGDTIISTVRTYLKAIAYIDKKYNDFICSTGFAVFTPNNKILPKFLFHALQSEWFVSTVEANSVGISYPAINTSNIVNYKIAIPPIQEQKQIADYLDKKCGEIDRVVETEKVVIEKLKEYKQSIITEAVTKGLDKSTPLKDSGIEWIGKIPQHWGVVRLKYKFRIKKDIAGKEGFDILSVTQRGLKVKDITTNEGQLAMDYSKYQLVEPTDFVMNHMDLLTGWVDCSIYSGVTSPDYRVFVNTDKQKCDNEYYKHIFQTCYRNKIFFGLGQGVSDLGRWRLQADKFLNFVIPVPPLAEQEKINDFINNKCSEIDKAIADKEQVIEKFTEYKKSLIYECVTGKRKVVS